jgi:hypothetical protein
METGQVAAPGGLPGQQAQVGSGSNNNFSISLQMLVTQSFIAVK